ncbi:MAG: hypothetical protein KAS04_04970, partial [Candidatus Aenigmarchaeota archaeon]|nr:hypothetical protein [Candidatus Aenigmarchaeota archaeon]
VKSIYNLRSDIVHEAKNDASYSDYKNVHACIYNLLLLLINIHHKFKTKKEFLKKLSEIKFGKRYTFHTAQKIISH